MNEAKQLDGQSSEKRWGAVGTEEMVDAATAIGVLNRMYFAKATELLRLSDAGSTAEEREVVRVQIVALGLALDALMRGGR